MFLKIYCITGKKKTLKGSYIVYPSDKLVKRQVLPSKYYGKLISTKIFHYCLKTKHAGLCVSVVGLW